MAGRRRLRRAVTVAVIALAGIAVAVTAASFGYNLATDGPAPRPAGLLMARSGGFGTRYRTWGTSGTPIVLVPGAFETADTFGALGAVLGKHHRVFAVDLTGTGYSAPSPPFSAGHLAAQVLSFLAAKGLTGRNAPILVGHSSGAAVAGLAALRGPGTVRGVVFLDGDALPLGGPSFLGPVLVNPYRTTILRLALGSSWLIRRIYGAQCGPSCAPLSPAGVRMWRLPLEQPGFEESMDYTLRHGIPNMTSAEFGRLRAVAVPKRVIYGEHDPQMPASDAKTTATRIGAPPPVTVPGRHLTMISSPRQLAAAVQAFASAP
ncbi:MAG TPA: alpha/beta hydrolase [Streptosporangiaceae bacterium]|nr:alpha/beta hydrolase [Streptosporangiaceae bacterium]